MVWAITLCQVSDIEVIGVDMMTTTVTIVAALAILISGAVITANIPITGQVAYTETESYNVPVPYDKPVYETVDHTDPIYETIDHSDPVYETLYNVALVDGSVWGDEVYRVSNVYDMKNIYSGDDAWGNSEYTVTVYYYRSIPDGTKAHYIYYEIDESSKTSYSAIVGYNDWSEEVIIGYDDRSEEVIIGYDVWSEEVFSHYETAYNVVEKSRTVTKYRDETRPLYTWI